jgi:hypothetical protein
MKTDRAIALNSKLQHSQNDEATRVARIMGSQSVFLEEAVRVLVPLICPEFSNNHCRLELNVYELVRWSALPALAAALLEIVFANPT